MMIDESFLTYLACGFIAAGSVIVLIVCAVGIARRMRRPAPSPDVKRDWMATGRINAVAGDARKRDDVWQNCEDDFPADWLVTVQEDRLVSDVSGDANVEIRWRKATKHEVKAIVASYHKHVEGLGAVTAEKRERSFFAPVDGDKVAYYAGKEAAE